MGIRDYGIIFGNDTPGPGITDNLTLSRAIAPYVDGTKIEFYNKELVKYTRRQTKKPVIADWKLSAIGFWDKMKEEWTGTMSKHILALKSTRADYVTCQLFPGIGSREAVEVASRPPCKLKIIGLAGMTQEYADFTFKHPLDRKYVKNVAKKYGIETLEDRINECKTISDFLLVMGEEVYRVDGYIGLGNDTESLKRFRQFTDKSIFATALGRQSKISIKEQMRNVYDICGRKSAVIVASYIWQSKNPIERAVELKQWREEMVGW